MSDLTAIIIVVLAFGIAWSVGLIIVPFYRAFNRGEIPSAFSLFFSAVTLCLAIYTAISTANGRLSDAVILGAFTLLSPPVAIVFQITELADLHFAGFAISFLILLIACFIALQSTSGRERIAIALFSVLPICTIPVMVESIASNSKIETAHEGLDGDCQSLGSFYQSMKEHGSSYAHFHALALKGDQVFVWSYRKQAFVELDTESTRYYLQYAPNSSCRN